MNADEIRELQQRHAKGLSDLANFQQWAIATQQRLEGELSAMVAVTKRLEQIAVDMTETTAMLERLVNRDDFDGEWWKSGSPSPF